MIEANAFALGIVAGFLIKTAYNKRIPLILQDLKVILDEDTNSDR